MTADLLDAIDELLADAEPGMELHFATLADAIDAMREPLDDVTAAMEERLAFTGDTASNEVYGRLVAADELARRVAGTVMCAMDRLRAIRKMQDYSRENIYALHRLHGFELPDWLADEEMPF